MNPFIRTVQYYETDMMGVTHHANYIHWMEESRIDFMNQIGFPYTRMESEGVFSPVTAISCEYKKPCTFGDTITIMVTVNALSNVRLAIGYEMRNQTGAIVCLARSEHTFLNREGRIVSIKRAMPDFCRALENAIKKELPEAREIST